MPDNIAAAVPVGVWPDITYTSFSESESYPMLVQQYHGSDIERALITDTVNSPVPLKTWRLSARLSSADLETLKTFINAHYAIPFYFYSPFDVTTGHHIRSNYDPSGANTEGRHIVVLVSQSWSQQTTLGRTNISGIELMEVGLTSLG